MKRNTRKNIQPKRRKAVKGETRRTTPQREFERVKKLRGYRSGQESFSALALTMFRVFGP